MEPVPLPPALTIQSNESFSRWVALILEALRRSLEQEQCLCLLEAEWPDTGAMCQWAHVWTDGATDTETSKRDSTVVQPEFDQIH